jgi:hypothetical protein
MHGAWIGARQGTRHFGGIKEDQIHSASQ